nr:MAG TPA: hypothetical protein [Caudoviricetes sp.]
MRSESRRCGIAWNSSGMQRQGIASQRNGKVSHRTARELHGQAEKSFERQWLGTETQGPAMDMQGGAVRWSCSETQGPAMD